MNDYKLYFKNIKNHIFLWINFNIYNEEVYNIDFLDINIIIDNENSNEEKIFANNNDNFEIGDFRIN